MTRTRLLVFAALAALVVGFAAGALWRSGARLPARPQPLGEGQAVIRAVDQVGAAVVKISSSRRAVVDSVFGPLPVEQTGIGSGVIFTADGYILTNAHVVSNPEDIEVTLRDGRLFAGQLVGEDPVHDLAVIKVAAAGLPTAPLGDSSRLEVGEPVIAIGNPLGFDYSVTTGVVSALDRSLSVNPDTGSPLEHLIQTDAAINPGNSGGPLIDETGRVIGINTAVVRQLGGVQAQGLGFAIPIAVADAAAKQLMRHGKPLRLGITGGTLTPAIARAIRKSTGLPLPVDQGVFVRTVADGSPAAQAALEPTDVVTAAGDKPIGRMDDLIAAVQGAGSGGRLVLTVYRHGRRLSVRVQL
ncbi:MAG TPA: trypsin-like peptidase domain-containing protein [Limnochordia bacterium]|nr:trypsin-like peptidase domain-containing protein [Limnochordia bacterium]